MKTHYRLRRSAALLCLAATLPVNCGRAQDQPKTPGITPAAQLAPNGALVEPYVLQIAQGTLARNGKQSEATLANVVDALRDIWPEANIVLAPELSKLKVADLKLRSTPELWEALEALRVASGYKFEWRKGLPNTGGTVGIDPATGLPRPPAGESSLYILDQGIDAQGHPLERARRMVEVFNLSGYLDHLPTQDRERHVDESLSEIMQTVSETLDSLGDGNVSENDRPHFRFHPGTRLLVVTGPPDAIEVARKVVTALTGQPGGGALLPGAELDANQRAAGEAFARRLAAIMKRQEPNTEQQEAIAKRYGLRPAPPNAPSTPAQPAPLNPPPAPANPALPPR
jgi:hypothetical protein